MSRRGRDEGGRLGLLAVVIATGALACSVGVEDNNPFATANPVGSSPPPMTSMSGTEGSDSESTGGGGGSGDSTGPIGPGDTTTSGMPDPTTSGPPMTTNDPTLPPDMGGGGGGGQPAMGMYSPCDEAADCTELCFQVVDAMMVVIDGFCTNIGCTNPGLDCDPSPGGTSTPVCVGVDVGGTPETTCALSCAAGATCPAGMNCYNFGAPLGELCA